MNRPTTQARNTANASSKLRLGIACAARTPNGTAIKLAGMMRARAEQVDVPKRERRPQRNIPSGPDEPERPGMEITGPKPDDVATALWIGKPKSVSSDTMNMPPPMLISAETRPMPVTASSALALRGARPQAASRRAPAPTSDAMKLPATTQTHFSAAALATLRRQHAEHDAQRDPRRETLQHIHIDGALGQ